MSEELIYLTRCCRLIEEKWQRGESRFWKNGDYQQLSELVSTATRISISPDTLKRLFGKTKTYRSYNPQLETKNALALFIGYEGWEDFKKSQPVLAGEGRPPVPAAGPATGLSLPAREAVGVAPHAVAPASAVVPVPPVPAPSREEAAPAFSGPARTVLRRYRPVAWVGLGLVLLAGLTWLSVPREGRREVREEAGRAGKPPFRARFPRDTVPHTVVFEYDISRVPADSIYIDYGYDHFGYHERELLPRDKRLITYYYHFPGRYTVRLRAGRQVLDSIPVEVLSRGWMAAAYLKNSRMESLDPKVLRDGYRREGRLYASPGQLRAGGIDSALVNWTEFSNVRTFGVDGDDFTLETRFRNSPADGGFACLESMLRVLGERNRFRLQFNQPGCARWATVQFGEIELDGKFNDLSPFSTAVSDWRVARLEVKRRRARVLLDGRLVYQAAYRQPVGAIRAIVYNFRGGGSVDYIRLYDARNDLVYADEFNR